MKLFIKSVAVFFLFSLGSCGSGAKTAEGDSSSSAQGATIAKDVNVQEFKELIKSSGVILDVRTPGECQNGMIDGAINVNYMGGDFKAGISGLDKNTPVYIYCAAGGRSAKAMKEMSNMGYTKLYNLLGGYGAWK